MSQTLGLIQELAAAKLVRVSEHGLAELSDDEIAISEVVAGVLEAVVVEDYPAYFKGPCVLCLQQDGSDRPIHVLWGLAAANQSVATVITAYRPDPAKWEADWLTRRKS